MPYDRTLGPSASPTTAPTGTLTVDIEGGTVTAEDVADLATTDDTFDAVILLAEMVAEQTRVLRNIDRNIAAMMGGMPEG